MRKINIKNSLLLILAALIWGIAFVPQKAGGENIGSFTFNAVRFFLGGLALIPVILFRERKSGKTSEKSSLLGLLVGGFCCGVMLFWGSSLQQIGLTLNADAGKAGFITALYMVIVPIFGLFIGKKPSLLVTLSVLIAVIGMYFLCISESLKMGKGEILVLIGAPFFALHILVVDFFVQKYDGVKLSCIQFFTVAVLSIAPMFSLETPSVSLILSAWIPLFYTGFLSSGVAYTLQVVGQKNVNPTVAGVLLSLESVFAVLAGLVLLGESLSFREGLGCALMFIAIILTQIPSKSKEGKI